MGAVSLMECLTAYKKTFESSGIDVYMLFILVQLLELNIARLYLVKIILSMMSRYKHATGLDCSSHGYLAKSFIKWHCYGGEQLFVTGISSG